MLRAEIIKLKRSSLWVIAVILPLLAVTTGSLNYWGNRGVLDQAWASLFGQVFLFYGMFYLSMGGVACGSRLENGTPGHKLESPTY